jgi:hypothetical protein
VKKNLLLYLLAIISLTSCLKKEETGDTLKSIYIGQDTLKLNVGTTLQVPLTITPSTYDKTLLVWKSADTSVLSISNTGLVSAKKMGLSKVTVSNQKNTISISCMVSVIDSLKMNLIAYYPFDNSPDDLSGNGNNGTLYNVTATTNRFNKANSAYYFNGTTSYITVPDKQSLRLNNTDFTLNAWVKLDTYNVFYGSSIWDKRVTDNDNGWSMIVGGYTQSPVGTIVFGPGGTSVNAFGAKVLNFNNWYMVTCVYKLSTKQLSIYVNGVLDRVTTNFQSPNGTISTLMYIGKDNPTIPANGYYLQGALDDMRMYGKALSTSQILQLYAASN